MRGHHKDDKKMKDHNHIISENVMTLFHTARILSVSQPDD